MSDTDHLATMTTREYEELCRKVDGLPIAELISNDQGAAVRVTDYLALTKGTLEVKADELRERAGELDYQAEELRELARELERQAKSVGDSSRHVSELLCYDPRDGGRQVLKIVADEFGVRLP